MVGSPWWTCGTTESSAELRGTSGMTRTRILMAVLMAATAVAVVPALGDVANAVDTPSTPRSELSVFPVLYNVGNINDLALGVRIAPDGAVYIERKSGLVQKYDSVSDTTATTVVNLQNAVYDHWDHGMLGMALDPSFTNSGYLYVLYSYNKQPGVATFPRWGSGGAGDQCPTTPGENTDGCVTSVRLSRFLVDSVGHAGSEQVLVDNDANGGWCEQFPSHSAGSLVFDSYGALYASAGDGASFWNTDVGQFGGTLPDSTNPVVKKNPCNDPPGYLGGSMNGTNAEGGAFRAQSARSLVNDAYSPYNGAIIRINKDTGAAMPDNPLVGNGIAGDDRIVAFGLRNGFRFNIRPGTRDLWVGDVGWDTTEEVSHFTFDPTQKVAGNFGWPCYEGADQIPSYSYYDMCTRLYADQPAGQSSGGFSAIGTGGSTSQLIAPTYTWKHADAMVGGCTATNSSSIGGPFITSNAWPSDLRNAYIFGDYSRKCIWAMRNSDPNDVQLLVSDAAVVDMQIGPSGDLYFLDGNNSTLYRLAPNNVNLPPVASFTATPSGGPTPLVVTVDASASNDPNPGDTLHYAWDFSDGAGFVSGNAITTHTFNATGATVITLRVTDASNASTTTTRTVTPNNLAPVIHSVTTNGAWSAGSTVTFSANVTDDQIVTASEYDWQIILNHCSRIVKTDCHQHYNTVQGLAHASSGSFTAPEHDWPTWLDLELTVTDASGSTATSSTRIDPNTASLTVGSNPAGVNISVGGLTTPAPFSLTEIQGSHLQIAAPPTATINGQTGTFSSWSDGSTNPVLNVTFLNADVSRTATYTMPVPPPPPPAPPPPPPPSGPPIGATEWALPFGNTYAILNGWAGDYDAGAGPINVLYTVNGRMAGVVSASRSRADVAWGYPVLGPNHGYTVPVVAPGTSVVICGYALNVGPGVSMPIGCTGFHRPKPKKVVRRR